MPVKIVETHARYDDRRALRTLLAGVPHTEGLRAGLLRVSGPGRLARYDREQQTLHYVLFDRPLITRISVSGINAEQAREASTTLDDVTEMNTAARLEVIEQVVGRSAIWMP